MNHATRTTLAAVAHRLTAGDVITYHNPVTRTPQTVVLYAAPLRGADGRFYLIGDSLSGGAQRLVGWQSYRPADEPITTHGRMTVNAHHQNRVLANVTAS